MVKLSVKCSPRAKKSSKDKEVVSEASSDDPAEMSEGDVEEVVSENGDDVQDLGNQVVMCVPKRLLKAVHELGARQRTVVHDIGFGGLLHLQFSRYPKDILPLILNAFDPISFMFKLSDKRDFLVSKDDVIDCFQLPCGPSELPLLGTARSSSSSQADAINLKQRWCRKFNVSKSVNGIPFAVISNKLSELCKSDDDGDEFKRLFVVLSMGTFLAPTSNKKIDFKLLKAVDDVRLISSYDWCSYIFDKLVEGCSKSTSKKKTLTGCLPVLYLAYFHRFSFRGVQSPSTLPLIQHWDYEKLASRAKDELATGSLGNAPMSRVKYPISGKSSRRPGNYFLPSVLLICFCDFSLITCDFSLLML